MSDATELISRETVLPLAGFIAASLSVAAIVVFFGYGAQAILAAIFALVLGYTALRYPLGLVLFLLLTGSLSWGFVTGDEKVFFRGLGGIDLNGVRLIGVTIAFSLLLIHNREGRRRFLTLKSYLVFLSFAAIGLVYSWNFNSGIRLFSKFLYPYLIFCVLLLEIDNLDTLRKVIRVMYWGGLLALISIPVSTLFGIGTEIDETMVKLGGGATHRNPFAFYVVCLTCLSASIYAFGKGKHYLWASLIGSIVVLSSVTRIAIAALAVSLGFVFFRRSIFKGVVAMALIIIVIGTYGPIQERMFYKGSDMTLWELLQEPSRFFTDVNAMGRFPAWGTGIYGMFLSSPIVGMGTGSTTGIEYETGNKLTAMHSEVVRILAEQGIVGTMLYLLAYAALLWKIRIWEPHASKMTSACSLAATAMVFAYFVICLTDNAFDYYTMIGQNIFAVSALAIRSMELDRTKIQERPDVV